MKIGTARQGFRAAILTFAAIGGLILFAAFCGVVTDGAREATRDNSIVSLPEYGALATGMSYADAQRIIGAAGEELSTNEIAGMRTVMYSWKNRDGSNMNAMFQNDKLVSKAQFGLK